MSGIHRNEMGPHGEREDISDPGGIRPATAVALQTELQGRMESRQVCFSQLTALKS